MNERGTEEHIMKASHNVNLGDLVKDRITGFQGVCTGLVQYLNGCVRAVIQPTELKDGKPIDAQWLDVEQVEVVHPGLHRPGSPGGGPMPDPVR